MNDVIVIGGGIAGCSAAIHLRQLGANVLLLERSHYPKHRLCGEFVSIESTEILESMGVTQEINNRNPVEIDHVRITTQYGGQWKSRLPGSAIGISRWALDDILFRRAKTLGVDSRSGALALDVSQEPNGTSTVTTTVGTFRTPIVLGAFGKKAAIEARMRHEHPSVKSNFVAYKQHYTGIGPDGTVEMHLFDGGYCGINVVEDRTVNVCWLIQRKLMQKYSGDYQAAMADRFRLNHFLLERMSGLKPIAGTLCATGDVVLSQKGLFAKGACMIGDSAQMIAPFCGDGMGMALKTGELIAPLCKDLVDGAITRVAFERLYKLLWSRQFSLRLKIGRVIQSAAISPIASHSVVLGLGLIPSAGRLLIQRTRGINGVYTPTSKTQPSIVNPGPNASAAP